MEDLVAESGARLRALEEAIDPLRKTLAAHPLYAALRTPADIRMFMESHVFAVWDFMSLLKALQRELTCVGHPWVPSASPLARRFINEIVMGEESDAYRGRAVSHFELYLEAMDEIGADASVIRSVLRACERGEAWSSAAGIPAGACAFTQNTFDMVTRGSAAAHAAAFAFGREDTIPDMFRALVRQLNQEHAGQYELLLWYLERHIEVDGDDHGPLALKMVSDVCGDDDGRWNEATDAAASALCARIALWDSIFHAVSQHTSA